SRGKRARPDERENDRPPRASEDEQPERRIAAGDHQVDAGVIETARPAPLRRRPGDPMVEGAGAEHDRHGGGVDCGGKPRPTGGGFGDEYSADRERDDECVEVEYAAQPWPRER